MKSELIIKDEDRFVATLKFILCVEQISQVQLAKKLGLTKQAINNKLNKDRLPRLDKLIKFLDGIGYQLVIRKSS
ncbi:MAG: helix-turn-helix transcriptional regulator [bacterium]